MRLTDPITINGYQLWCSPLGNLIGFIGLPLFLQCLWFGVYGLLFWNSLAMLAIGINDLSFRKVESDV
jgi:membrane protein required for beta-lactamase induction